MTTTEILIVVLPLTISTLFTRRCLLGHSVKTTLRDAKLAFLFFIMSIILLALFLFEYKEVNNDREQTIFINPTNPITQNAIEKTKNELLFLVTFEQGSGNTRIKHT
jgi:hypothetical protein